MFGLGRYLYNLPQGWADFDPATKRFTEKAKAKLMGILVQHYRRVTDHGTEIADIFASESTTSEPDVEPDLLKRFNELGVTLYGEQWPQVRQRNVGRISEGKTSHAPDLQPDQIEKLIHGMEKLRDKRLAQAA